MKPVRALPPLLSALVATMPFSRGESPEESRPKGMPARADGGPFRRTNYRRYWPKSCTPHEVNITRECARRVRQRERDEANREVKALRRMVEAFGVERCEGALAAVRIEGSVVA
jgi:hypothetical protein